MAAGACAIALRIGRLMRQIRRLRGRFPLTASRMSELCRHLARERFLREHCAAEEACNSRGKKADGYEILSTAFRRDGCWA